jgi:hypothetical protein
MVRKHRANCGYRAAKLANCWVEMLARYGQDFAIPLELGQPFIRSRQNLVKHEDTESDTLTAARAVPHQIFEAQKQFWGIQRSGPLLKMPIQLSMRVVS